MAKKKKKKTFFFFSEHESENITKNIFLITEKKIQDTDILSSYMQFYNVL